MTVGDLLEANTDESLNEVDTVLVAGGLFWTFAAALKLYPKVKEKINENRFRYWITDKPVNKVPEWYEMRESPKLTVARELYINGIKRAEKSWRQRDHNRKL